MAIRRTVLWMYHWSYIYRKFCELLQLNVYKLRNTMESHCKVGNMGNYSVPCVVFGVYDDAFSHHDTARLAMG
jgi:hypothetical protein